MEKMRIVAMKSYELRKEQEITSYIKDIDLSLRRGKRP